MNRLRTKLLLAMLTIVVATAGVSALMTRRVTHQEIRRIMVLQGRTVTASNAVDERTIDRRLFVPFAVAIAIAVLLTLLLTRTITTPVERLTRAVETMATGQRPEHVAVSGGDEIAQLARSFNAMADAIAEQQELRQRMVGDVAHELRTPLTNLRCELEAAQDGLAAIDPGSLHEEVQHLSRLVDDLQELTVVEQLHREPIDLGATIASAIDLFRGEASRRGIALSMQAAPVTVDADRMRIGQIMRNLLSNAMAHTPDGGRIDVSVVPTEVSVANTGPHIPDRDLDRVFERFYRTDEARARNDGGAGLGLAIVKRLVELHGGRVWAQNVEEGVRFTFTLSS